MQTTGSCEEIEKLLSDYAEGELDDSANRSVELHLAACRPCTGELTLMRALVSGLHRIPEETAPAAVMAAITRRLPAARKSPAPVWRFGWRPVSLGFAAAGALALAVITPILWRPSTPDRPIALASAPATGTTIATVTAASGVCTLDGRSVTQPSAALVEGARLESSGPAQMAFADGSTIALAAGARLVAGADEVQLETGKIDLSVEKQKLHFRVRTPEAVVTVWGTRFTVQHGSVTAVEVQEGKVQVEAASGAGPASLLTAGMRAEVDRGRIATPAAAVIEPVRAEDTRLPLADDR